MMHKVYLALGTNIGDRLYYLETALSEIDKVMPIVKRSPIYESDPMYETEQPQFLNMACCVQTALPPIDVLNHAKRIEKDMGRTETYRNGPRVIDIDVVFYGDKVVYLETPDLTIPHERYQERGFVLKPMVDLNADFVCPRTLKTMQQYLDDLMDTIANQNESLGISVYK